MSSPSHHSPSPRLLQTLVVLLFGVICLPGLQRWLHLVDEKKLDGYTPTVAQHPDFSDTAWWQGTYQRNKAGWLNENFGFRTTLLRLHNQIGYSFWNHSYTNAVIVGRDGFLFDKKYIHAWNGLDFSGEDSIKTRVQQLFWVQQQLQERGTTLLLVLAPGKATYYSDYLPENVVRPKGPTNYAVYSKLLEQYGVNTLDCQRWFERWRITTQYPLFPKCGIHWSTYAATLVGDSISKRLGKLRGTVLSPMVIERVVVSDSANFIDSDVGRGMNLLVEPKGFPLAYPLYHFDEKRSTEKPSLLAIGDSYFWTHDPFRFDGKVYRQTDFYYYNRDWHLLGEGQRSVDTAQALTQALAHDVIVIYCTDANLPHLGWGFIEQVYRQLKAEPVVSQPTLRGNSGKSGLSPAFAKTIPPAVAKIMIDIRKDPAWFASIEEKARMKGISADSMLYIDARFIIDEQRKKKK